MASTTDDTLVALVRGLPAKKRKVILERLRVVPENAKQLWSNTRRFYKPGSGQDFLKVRLDMLEAANWDPAGWSIMEWERLPSKLKTDLDKVFPMFQKMIREEGEALLRQLEGGTDAHYP